MALVIKNPTANESPDAGQGGQSVDLPTNTGHGNSIASASNGSSQQKSCRWSGFQAVSGQIKSVTLKVTHGSDGSLSGAGAANLFRIEYSLNNGVNWLSAVLRSDFTTVAGDTFAVALSTTQDLSQVQVRDFLESSTVDPGTSATAGADVSDIKIEVVTVDAQVIVMM